jgi:hypothetical protein
MKLLAQFFFSIVTATLYYLDSQAIKKPSGVENISMPAKMI